MSLAEDLLAASKFNPAEFYKPSRESVPKTLCARCETNPRVKGISYCTQCNSLRERDYNERKRTGGAIRKYNKKGIQE